jgi:hypothetical protein
MSSWSSALVSRRRLPVAAAVVAGAALVLLAGGTASAYPQWQFASGTSRCSQCHYSPAGGGLINGYGRDAVGEDLSTWEGDGGFLHGWVDLPKAVAFGGDFRYAVLNHDVGEAAGAQFAYFPMQADAELRLAFSDSVSVYVNAGYRGRARGSEGPGGAGAPQPATAASFISREHYLMWRPAAQGAYVRVGRFFAPFGLRLAEHGSYVRRDTGFNTLEESYNVSGGYLKNDWEIHLTAFMPDVVRYMGGRERGGAAMAEVRLGEASALGLQTRVGMTDDMYRYTGGAFGKTYFEAIKTLIQAEANVIHKTYSGKASSKADQMFAGYLGVTLFPGRGFWITPFAERVQTSIQVKESATNGGGVQLNWFPYPHFEITGQARVQLPEGSDSSAMTGIVFVHYYL